jgi:hypothetical protein
MEFQLTKNQQQVFDAVENTNNNYLICGKPGVGKSVLTRALTELGRKTYTLGAPTGLAALNIETEFARAKTLHSLFRLPVSGGIVHPTFNNFTIDDHTLKHIRYQIKHLIIDEISMVRADMFDYIDRLLRFVKGVDLPFGGIQVICIGDFYQLPPIVQGFEQKQMEEVGYDSPFIFSSKVFAANFSILTLSEVLRQKGDPKFIDLLDNARTGYMTPKNIGDLNRVVHPADDLTIRLSGTNAQADEVNSKFLAAIGSPSFQYIGEKFGEWPALPVDLQLTLKVGAQVIVKVNGADRPPNYKGKFVSEVVNGTLGKVSEIIETIEGERKVIIETLKGSLVTIYTKRWERKVKVFEDDAWQEKIVASYTQMPLQLAWAISIHKSQGQSFDKVHIDARKIFAPGQMYVALSRCRSLKGLSLETEVNARKFWINPKVVEFFESIEV